MRRRSNEEEGQGNQAEVSLLSGLADLPS
jgi:hypothetical protein